MDVVWDEPISQVGSFRVNSDVFVGDDNRIINRWGSPGSSSCTFDAAYWLAFFFFFFRYGEVTIVIDQSIP